MSDNEIRMTGTVTLTEWGWMEDKGIKHIEKLQARNADLEKHNEQMRAYCYLGKSIEQIQAEGIEEMLEWVAFHSWGNTSKAYVDIEDIRNHIAKLKGEYPMGSAKNPVNNIKDAKLRIDNDE